MNYTNAADPLDVLGQKELDSMRKSGFDRNRAKDGIVFDPNTFYVDRKELNASWSRTFGIKTPA